MDDAGALAYLEGALAGVFGSAPTPPARMQHLERELSGYRAEPGAWRQCARFIKMTDNPEVHWFAHSVFEHTVACGWDAVEDSDKAELREFVYMCIKEQHKSTPTHVVNKMYKVYAKKPAVLQTSACVGVYNRSANRQFVASNKQQRVRDLNL